MKKIKVYYTPGAFGNFLGYLIDCYNNKKLLPSPLLPAGSSHGRYRYEHKTLVYPINLDPEYKVFLEDKEEGIGLTWKSQYFFYILHAVYSRTNSGQYGECGVRAMEKNFWKFYTMHNAPLENQLKYWKLLLVNLKEFYNFDCNEQNQVVPKLILRQLFFFYMVQSQTNMVTIRNNEILKRRELQLVDIDVIFDYEQLKNLLGIMFGYDLDFSKLHKKFIEDNMSLKAFNLKNYIVDCVFKKINEPIPDIDVVTEAGILFELEKHFYDIPFHNIPEFFKDTGSIITYINSFPNFMKQPNKLFQQDYKRFKPDVDL